MAEPDAGVSLTEESVQEILMEESLDKARKQSRCLWEPAPDYLLYVYLIWVWHIARALSAAKLLFVYFFA